MADKLRTPAPMRRGLMHGFVPVTGLPSGPAWAPAWTTARELARQRHLRLVLALRVPRNLCSPLPDLMLRRLVAPGRA